MSEPSPPAAALSTQPVAGRARPSLFARVCVVVVLVLLSTTGVLAGGELFARAFCDAPVNPYRAHPYVARIRTPGFKQYKMTIDDPARPFLFEANALGYRGKKMTSAKKPPGTYRIFFVGASTTENQQLEEERTFPGIVQAKLDERFHDQPRIEVANCGIVGYGIERSFAVIAHEVLQLQPDLVIVNDGGTDMILSLGDGWDPSNIGEDAYTYSFKEWLVTESRLAAVLDARFSTKDVDMRRHSFEKKVRIARAKPYFVPKGLDLRRGLPLFETWLRRIALIGRDAGVPVYFMTQATIWKKDQPKEEEDSLWMGGAVLAGPIHVDPGTLASLMAQYNDGIREVAAAHHCGVIDLAARVPKNLECFIDDAHFTAKGNAVVADAVLDAILPDGHLPGPVTPAERPR